MEAGGKYIVKKGWNSVKNSKLVFSVEYRIICHRRNLITGVNWIFNDKQEYRNRC